MTEQHPITVPAGSITCWRALYRGTYQGDFSETEYIVNEAARWGADQELEAVINLAGQSDLPEEDRYFDGFTVAGIRANRRRTSLKEQALEVLGNVQKGWGLAEVDLDTIRRALEALPE
jgi:hypothetical protein